MEESTNEWDMTGAPMVVASNIDPNPACVKMAAVGRKFRLGQFYDYRNDALMSECLWGYDGIKLATDVDIQSELKVSLHDCPTWSSRWEHAGLSDHLRASVAADLIGKYRGASAYIADECDLSDALQTLRVRYKQRRETIDLDGIANADVGHQVNIRCPREATHVVVGVQYGVESFNLFSCPVGSDESKQDVEDDVRQLLEEMSHALRDGDDESELKARLEDRPASLVEKLKCRHYADLQASARDVRLLDALRLIRKRLADVREHADHAVPLTVTLCPLNHLIPEAKVPACQDVGTSLLDDCGAIFDALSRDRMRVQGWLRNETIKTFRDFRSSLRQFVDFTGKFKAMLHGSLKRAVVQSRCGGPDDQGDDAVMTVIDSVNESVFCGDGIERWVKHKKNEMRVLETVGRADQVEGVCLVQSESKLDDHLFDLTKRFTLVLKLPSLQHKDPLLKAMKTYVENNKRLSRTSAEVPNSDQLHWYMANDARQELVASLSQLAEHAKSNRHSERVAFLVTSLLSDAAATRPRLALYQGGKCVDDDFQLPAPPSDVALLERTDSHAVVEWQCPAAHRAIGFSVRYRLSSERSWQHMETSGKETRARIGPIAAAGHLCIQVATRTNGGMSSYSSVCETAAAQNKCLPPSLSVGRVTHNSVELNWPEPRHSAGMAIRSYRIEYHPQDDPAAVKQLETTKTTCLLVSLKTETEYVIRAVADCGADGRSSPGEPLTCSTLVRAQRFAETLKGRCRKIGRVAGLDLLLVPLEEQRGGSSTCAKRFVFGKGAKDQKHRKTILLVGATGSGKTTLINGLINYIFGVEWRDNFRFKLIHEQMGTSQAHSQTNCVAAYDIHWHPGMNIPYSLTIVDTPGYGDTKGLSRDKQITDIISRFFNDTNGIQQLDAVGFVSQASLPRLTPTQVYIFDSVLSIFGNDIGDNISLLLTFADSQLPPVLSAIAKAEIPCPKDALGRPVHHKFNNSGFFASNLTNGDPVADEFNAHFWTMGTDSFARFFAELNKMRTKSLSLTKQVLEERKQLEATVEGLQPLIQQQLVKLEELRKTKQAIDNNQAQIDANVNVEIEVEVTEAQKVDISHTGHFLTNCSKCHVTCHYPCAIPRDEDKRSCAAMRSGRCYVCPEKCVWNVHFNQTYRWQYVTVKKSLSSADVKRKYEELLRTKLSAQGLVDALENDLQDIELRVLQSVTTVAECIQRLEAIALRPNPFSTPQYIDLMITSELQEKKTGFKERVESLRQLRQQAEITDKIRSGQSLLPEHPRAGSATASAPVGPPRGAPGQRPPTDRFPRAGSGAAASADAPVPPPPSKSKQDEEENVSVAEEKYWNIFCC